MSLLTVEMIKAIAPTSEDTVVFPMVDELNTHLPEYGIDTWLRVTHFLAQAAHETDDFKVLEEYASGAAYEGRKDLGNTQKGDGVKYKGRGIFQLTGRYNYDIYGQKLGLDLINNPELAETPRVAVLTACEFWKGRNIQSFADNNDVTGVTRRINPGLLHLDRRKIYLARAQKFIPKDIFSQKRLPPIDINSDVLAKLGDRNQIVEEIQQLLYNLNYDINVDGIFGPRTELIIRDFQQRHGLLANGIVDSDTMDRLKNG